MTTIIDLDVRSFLPQSLPDGWRRRGNPFPEAGPGGPRAYQHSDGLVVLVSAAVIDGKRWMHVSMSRADLPTYNDMCRVKAIWCGRDRDAVQVFARESQHVNIHPNVLHLWCCLDGHPLPDFGAMGTI